METEGRVRVLLSIEVISLVIGEPSANGRQARKRRKRVRTKEPREDEM